jgi:hypothetical protein
MKRKRSAKTATVAALAKALEFSRPAVAEWAKRPDAPALGDVAAWKRYVAAHNLGVVGNRVSPERELTLQELNKVKLRLGQLEVARREGRAVLRSDMDALHHAIFTRQMAVLSAALVSEYPGKVVGRTAAEIRVYGEQLRDRVCSIFTRDVEQWVWSADDPKP